MTTVFVVFLSGLVLLLIGQIRKEQAFRDKQKQDILTNEDSDKTIVYKYLPRDIDTFYRTQDTPSKLYSGSVF